MAENPPGHADAAGLRGGHELLLPEGEDLAADQTGDARPAQEAQHQHQGQQPDLIFHLHGVHGGADDDHQGHGGDAVEHVHHAHDDVVHPFAEVAGDAAQDDADHRLDDDHHEAHQQGHPAAVHQAGEHVHAVAVGAQGMGQGRVGVAVKDVGLGLLVDRPHLLAGVIGDLVIVLLAVLAGVDEVGDVVLQRLLEAGPEVGGDHHAGLGGLHHKAADIGHVGPVLEDVAVLVQGVAHPVGGELALAGGEGLQGGVAQVEGQLLIGVHRADNVLEGDADDGVAGVDGVEILPLLLHGVVHVPVVEGGLPVLLGQQELGAQAAAHLLAVGHGVAELLVLGGGHVFVGLHLIGVEHLGLAVGGDHPAHKGEEEHGGQHDQAQHRQPVAEKPLGHQGPGGEHLHPALVVQGEVLAAVLGGVGAAGAGLVQQALRPLVLGGAGIRGGLVLQIVQIVFHFGFLPSLRDAHAGVHHRVQNVRNQVAQQRQDGQEGHIEHGEGDVTHHHGLIGDKADAVDGEQGLGNQGAGEQARQRAAHDGHQGDQGVAEGVVIDDLALAQALGPGGADIVGVEHFQHVGAGVAHQRAHGDDDQGDDGQHQMVGDVPELAPAVHQGVVAADHAGHVEPAQLHREHQLQDGGEKEGGQGDAHQGAGGDRVVGAGVLLGGGHDAQGDGNDQLEHQGDGPHDEGDGDHLHKLVNHRDGPAPAVAEVAGEHVLHLDKIAGDDVQVQTILGVELGHPLVIGLGARGGGQLPGHALHVGGGQAAQQRVNDKRHAEQDQN